MKKLITMALLMVVSITQAQIKTLVAGEEAPAFKLKNVNNKVVSFSDFPKAKGFIVVFTCNTCPVAKDYEQRIIALNAKSVALGYPVIAINPNDPAVSKGDAFVDMQERAKDKKYAFPYLFDEGQVITNAYGATKTPEIFLVQKTAKGNIIQYTGAIDDDPEDTNTQKKQYIHEVIAELNANKKPTISGTKAIGCTVKRAKK